MRNVVQIIPGGKAVFKIHLRDEDGAPVSLTPFASGTLRFRNCAGVVTSAAVVLGANPDAGIIAVEILSAVTANADEKWTNADLILVESGNPVIFPLVGNFEILEAQAPAS